MVFVDWLAKVPPFLFIPPVGMGIAKLTLDTRRVDVAAVLRGFISPRYLLDHGLVRTYHVGILGSSEFGLYWILLVHEPTSGERVGEEGSAL